MTLRWRFVLLAGALLFTVILTLEAPLSISIGESLRSEDEALHLGSAGLLAGAVADRVAHSVGVADEDHAMFDMDAAIEAAVVNTNTRTMVVARSGEVLADTGENPRNRIPVEEWPELGAAVLGEISTAVRGVPGLEGDAFVVAVPVVEAAQIVGAVQLVTPRADLEARIAAVRWRFVGIGLVALLAGLGLIWVVTGAVTRPVGRLEEAARRLGAGDLSARTNPSGPSDIASLGESFNQMAGALSAGVAAQRDFVANASHQLRTPLTGLRLRLDNMVVSGSPGAEEALVEVERLGTLVDDLLTLARASADEESGRWVPLAQVAEDTVERWAETAERERHRLVHEGGPGRAWSNPEHIELMLDNLIDNAIRYTPPGTTIAVRSEATSAGSLLVVADDGPGIADPDRARVFERFKRGSNKAGVPGTGLGLAIVVEIAARWGGTVRLAESDGTRVEIAFAAAGPNGAARRADPGNAESGS